MLAISTNTLAGNVIATSRDVGAKLPAAVTDAHDRASRVIKAAQSIYPPRDALVNAVIAALDAGRDPAADPAVQRAHLAQQIGSSEGVSRQVEDIVGGQMREAFSTHAEAIVKAWAKPFDQAAKTIVACHQRIGNVPLEDTATILRAGGDIASVWAQAQDAVAVVDKLAGAWLHLASLTRFAPVDPGFPALRIAVATADEWDAADFGRRMPGAWDVQLAGLTLSLADGAEYARRIAAIQQDWAAATQQAEEAGKRAMLASRRVSSLA